MLAELDGNITAASTRVGLGRVLRVENLIGAEYMLHAGSRGIMRPATVAIRIAARGDLLLATASV